MENLDNPIVASGFWWTDPKDGTRRWMTGDQMLAHIRNAVADERKKARKDAEELAYQLGRKFAEERERLRKDIAVLRGDLEMLQKALPPRVVKAAS